MITALMTLKVLLLIGFLFFYGEYWKIYFEIKEIQALIIQ